MFSSQNLVNHVNNIVSMIKFKNTRNKFIDHIMLTFLRLKSIKYPLVQFFLTNVIILNC